MDFSKNIKAFLGTFPIKNLSGHQMFLAIAAHHAKGNTSTQVNVADVRNKWPKSLLKIKYNSIFYGRAQEAGWVNPIKQGVFLVTDDGVQHLSALVDSRGLDKSSTYSGGLYIFDKKSTHSFDKFLRGVFANAKSKVLIADSWVDETIFDNVLDVIPKTLDINLIYTQKRGTFDSRVVRFKKEYSKFVVKRYNDLHDRFLVVDGIGYILGPSIKDAAVNSPALVVSLGASDSSALLIKFFGSLWLRAK